MRGTAGASFLSVRPIHPIYTARRLFAILLEAIFPGICCNCSALYRLPADSGHMHGRGLLDEMFDGLMGPYLCKACRQQFMLIESPFCEQCGEPYVTPHGVDHLCSQCLAHPFAFKSARALGLYEGGLKSAIVHFKYKGGDHLAKPLSALLWRIFMQYWQPSQIDLIVPVPLHPRRLRWRGFNQAFMLTRQWPQLAKVQGVAVPRTWIYPDLLLRKKYTQPQTGLKKEQRKANLRNAFDVNKNRKIEGARILLVDDVLTTGATAQACARILLKAGAAEVNVLTLARAVM